jgi:MerR family transcriptional regulator, copper efflux regulator
MERGLFIGEIATRSGLSRKALRLYEARGILSAPRRTASGYRSYPADVLGLLAFVGRARRLGLTLGEIAHVVAFRRAGVARASTSASS